jgi:predicted nuclease of restriction endonuclease-like (RecB) superfamily
MPSAIWQETDSICAPLYIAFAAVVSYNEDGLVKGRAGMSEEIAKGIADSFSDVVKIVEASRESAFRKVNEELILMYWRIGEHLSAAMMNSSYGDGYIQRLADYFAENHPELKGFTRRGFYRMKQFYEAYAGTEIVSALLTQLGWSQHLKLLSACKTIEERIFYMQLTVKERYSVRELERQVDSGYYERYMLSTTASAALPERRDITSNVFRDNYVLEFLDVKEPCAEKDLRSSIVLHLKDFVLEIGKDFTFVGEEYRVQVGNHDYYLDLLFYHRGLSCLVAFELKIGEFQAEYIGKMGLYLEALDREVKKESENPSVGVILCASKDDEVVEFALSRSLSPTMVSEYTLKLIDKRLLQQKLKEIIELSESGLTDAEEPDL